MINIPSAFKISFRALRINKMRSALTMLGIIIGVMAVIAMLAVGAGARDAIAKQISSIGSNLLIVLSGAATAGGVRMSTGTEVTLNIDDANAILNNCPAVAYVAPIHSDPAQVVFGHQNWFTNIMGSTPSILIVQNWTLAEGRVFTDQEAKTEAKVALLGKTVVQNLFGDMDPVGKTIRIKDVPFRVIGVLAPKGQSIIGQDQDDAVYIPILTAQKRLFGVKFAGMIRVIVIQAKSETDLDAAQDQVTKLLRQRHRIAPKMHDDFDVRNLTQMLDTMKKVARIMTILLGSIAAISLLVGGIGIMNIMLVSVTERTREIGIRMAVGAKTWDIRLQFIIEAVSLSLTGGVFGILLGIGLSELVTTFSGFPVIISVMSIIISFGFSGLVGIFFGFYPAYKASLLNPIDALRYE